MRNLDSELVFQAPSRVLIKDLKVEVATESLLLFGFRRWTFGPLQREHGRKAQLSADVVENPDRDGGILTQEASVLAQHAELDGKPATVVVAAAAQYLYPISRRERPVPGQFLLRRIFRQMDDRTALPRRENSLRWWGLVVIRHMLYRSTFRRLFSTSSAISSAVGWV